MSYGSLYHLYSSYPTGLCREEWVRNSNDQIKAETHSRLEVEKALGALKEEHAQLSKKFKDSDKARLSAEAGLKTMER